MRAQVLRESNDMAGVTYTTNPTASIPHALFVVAKSFKAAEPSRRCKKLSCCESKRSGHRRRAVGLCSGTVGQHGHEHEHEHGKAKSVEKEDGRRMRSLESVQAKWEVDSAPTEQQCYCVAHTLGILCSCSRLCSVLQGPGRSERVGCDRAYWSSP